MNPREIIIDIYQAAVAAVDPRLSVAANLQRIGDWRVRAGQHTLAVPPDGIYVIALGKAAVPMADAAIDALGSHVRRGIAITKEGVKSRHRNLAVLQGAHPVPDERSLNAGERLLAFAAETPEDALVICLISGGGSALVEAPRAGVSFEEIQRVTGTLLRAGASIHELNAVRSRLSRIKGGGVLRTLGSERVVNMILSDVIGDDPATIASGPTVLSDTVSDAERVVEQYGLEVELPRQGSQIATRPINIIVGSLRQALEAAEQSAVTFGYSPYRLSRSLEGEASQLGQMIGQIASDAAAGWPTIAPGNCLLAGGETTVTVTGDGHGGRNTEAALGAALAISEVEDVTIGFLASDGDDAETGAAGAIVDGATIRRADHMTAIQALRDNDSFTYLQERGAIYAPGPTGTNVNDLVIALIGQLNG